MTSKILPRRYGYIAAGGALALALAGCGGSGSANGGADVEQDDSAPLQVWIRKAPDSPPAIVAQEFLDAFTAETGYEAELTPIQDGFETRLQQAAAQQDLPDIVLNDSAQRGTLVEQGLVREVVRDEFGANDVVLEQAWDQATGADGNIYGVPVNAQAFALFIRSDWREAVGADVPETWDDLDALAEAFTNDDPNGSGQDDTYGWVIPASTERGYAAWYFWSFQYSAGGDILTGDEGNYTPANAEPATVEAAEWVQNAFCEANTVAPGAITMDTPQAHQAFEAGVGGMYFTGPYNMPRFDDSMGSDVFEVVQLPPGPGGESVSMAEGENVYLMAGSQNEAGQVALAEFAVSEEGQTILMAGDGQGNIVRVPVNANVDMLNVRTDERWQVFADAYETARYEPNVPDWMPFRQAQGEALNTIWSDCGADVQGILEDLDENMVSELESQGGGA